MNKVNNEKRLPVSVKLNAEEKMAISQAAETQGESMGSYMRRAAVEAAINPFYTGIEVMQTLLAISYDLSRLTMDNYETVVPEINRKGEKICRILSLK